MKKLHIIGIIFLLIISLKSFGLTATQIMNKADEILKTKNSISINTMIITTSTGSKRKFLQWGMSLGERAVTKFASGYVKGMTMLSLNDGDEIWVYFRSSGRTRRLASHAKNSSVAGSDFSYNDMSNTKYAKKYNCTLINETGSFYTLKLIPKKNYNIQYSKLLVKVQKNNFITKEILYYNNDGEKFKKLIINKIKTISGIITPMKFEMINLITKSISIVEIKKIKYLSVINRRFFSSGNLSRSLETWKAHYPFFNN